MKRRILSIITALALCLSLCPTWALAAEADPALCPHHREHTEDCGYTAPAEGQPCGHEHTAECCALEVLPDTDSGDDYEIGADAENLLDCQHTHDSECGYAQADPGQPCGYECRICPIEDLIDALPGKVTEDNADEVRAQLDQILALFSVLTEDEQEQIDLSRCYALQGVLDGANAPMLAADGAATVEINGVTTTYSTFKDAWDAANNGGWAVLTLYQDVDMGNSTLMVNAGSNITLLGGGYTITSNGNTTIQVNGEFTLMSGTIKNTTSMSIFKTATALYLISGSAAAVNGGSIWGNAGIYVSPNSTLTMTGGEVHPSLGGTGIQLTYDDNSTSLNSSLSSGTIVCLNATTDAVSVINPDILYDYRFFLSSLLAEGCAYYNESGNLIDYPNAATVLKGTVKIDTCDHSSVNWEKNETNHWGTCNGCKADFPSTPHSFTECKDLGDGTHQISCECGLVQETTAHTYGEWRDDNGSHVRTCTACGSVDSGTHSFNWQDNDSDTHIGSCAVCGLTETGTHSFSGWRDDGGGTSGTHTRTCSVCGRIETAPHSWVWTPVATVHNGICSDCGAKEQENHKVSGYQQKDEVYHYINCSVCGEKVHNVFHRYADDGKWVDTGDAHTQTCLDCGYAKSESHAYGPYQQNGEESHFRVCTVCGHKETGVHTAKTSW